jgi:hypothetical protein
MGKQGFTLWPLKRWHSWACSSYQWVWKHILLIHLASQGLCEQCFWLLCHISQSIILFWFVSNLPPPRPWDLNFTAGKRNEIGIINRCYAIISCVFQPKAWQALRLLKRVNMVIIYKRGSWGYVAGFMTTPTPHLPPHRAQDDHPLTTWIRFLHKFIWKAVSQAPEQAPWMRSPMAETGSLHL